MLGFTQRCKEEKSIKSLFDSAYLPQFVGNPRDKSFPDYHEPEMVTCAKENGWTDFLGKVGFNPKSNAHIREPGILIKEPIFNNVTGIITRIQDHLQVVPNPFAENQINYPNLEKVFPGDWRTVENIYKERLGYSGLDYLKSN